MRLNEITIIKRSGRTEPFNKDKIKRALKSAFREVHVRYTNSIADTICEEIRNTCTYCNTPSISIEEIQDIIENTLMSDKVYTKVGKAYVIYRENKKRHRQNVNLKKQFINKYKVALNTADATVDDNSNVSNKNIGILNYEIHKEDNIEASRGMIMDKIRELFPDFDAKQYVRDLQHHILYKHDESSFCGPIAPYCVSVTMYPFLQHGLKELGGLSARPKNLDSYCGMYPNLVFLVAAQYAGAVATPEFLVFFDYFARKEWGDNYYELCDKPSRSEYCSTKKNIRGQIHQYFQGVVYSINQPAGSRGLQSAFVNFAYFDKYFFKGMFDKFYFPDGTQPKWESLSWLQKEFMQWFNEERTKCMLTFPVESFALVHKDGEFADKDSADFVAEEYARGHSFFTYVSDTVDSLSSCCRLKNMVQTKEFNFTNGNMGVQTGSKSVITLNLNRIVQDWYTTETGQLDHYAESRFVEWEDSEYMHNSLKKYIEDILKRVYIYHIAYNECLWDMHDANLLPVYSAGFIHLNKQYLTIGLNGLNQAAEYLGIKCNDNEYYSHFCQLIFSTIKDMNSANNGKYNNHTLTFNTEQVPAESLAVKNYNWDKADGYWVPEDTNLYASYIFKPNDKEISILEKIRLHGSNYIGEYLDGGAAAHLNLEEHLTTEQYKKLLKYAAEVGCQYLTFNIQNCECQSCQFITKRPIDVCPKCGSTHIDHYDRVIGYLTKISCWSEGRRIEQKSRVYNSVNNL